MHAEGLYKIIYFATSVLNDLYQVIPQFPYLYNYDVYLKSLIGREVSIQDYSARLLHGHD